MAQGADAGREGGGAERVALPRGLLLPGLKRWRIRRGLTQQQLADRVGARLQYISRIEQGKRGCSPQVAQKIADALEVDLRDLGAAPDEGAPDERAPVGGAPVGGAPDEGTSETSSAPHYLHWAYLSVLLKREFGSAYLALDERELEEHVEGLSVEEAVGVISRRRQELEEVEGVLAGEGAELHPQVRLFLEELVRERPAEDIRVLAARRTREPSEGGRERLTRAMRELL